MKIAVNPARSQWAELQSRKCDDNAIILERVKDILAAVKSEGDAAVKRLTKAIDGVEYESIKVTEAEYAEAESLVSEDLKQAVLTAAANIRRFHQAQKFAPIEVETFPGVKCMQKALPIERVGLYIPGGSAPLFSTVLMLAIPAVVAGCRDIVLCTPTGKDGRVSPQVLWTARMCGVKDVFKMGGAIAVAAMAYGTESLSRRDKIFGPGNRYVTMAKQLVSKEVAIDMPAGPSEVMIMADESANPAFAASDMLSQAEHGPDSQAILLCKSESFALAAQKEVLRQTALLPRESIAEKALQQSRIIVLENEDEMVEFANQYASEHLIISMQDAWRVADKITAAGSIFVGHWSPESAGDYASGTNHTLPTSAWARSMGGVNVDSFQRKITYQELSAEGLEGLSSTIIKMAEGEGLEAHANAVKIRLAKL